MGNYFPHLLARERMRGRDHDVLLSHFRLTPPSMASSARALAGLRPSWPCCCPREVPCFAAPEPDTRLTLAT